MHRCDSYVRFGLASHAKGHGDITTTTTARPTQRGKLRDERWRAAPAIAAWRLERSCATSRR